MTPIIKSPENFENNLIGKVIDLVAGGGQVSRDRIVQGISHAHLVAIYLDRKIVTASACIKCPLESYRDNVFISTGAQGSKNRFTKELGYIAVHNDYQDDKLCQKLLTELFPFEHDNLFATTRNPAMAHILTKFGFVKLGDTYNDDLNLFVYYGKE